MAFKKGHTTNIGRKLSEETKRKIRLKCIGKHSGSFGKHWKLSEETKKKMRRPKSKETIEKFRKIRTGKKFSDATRLKMSGENCHLWKGGITPINLKIRTSLEYKLWRKSCFERDNFICQKTGISGGNLQVHHINNFADFPELRFDIDNGITLSQKAHKEFHKIYGKHNNTYEQLNEFLNKKVK